MRGRLVARCLGSADRVDVALVAVSVGSCIAAGVLVDSPAVSVALAACAASALAVAATIDRRVLRLPNVLTLPALVLATAAGAVAGHASSAVVGALVSAAPFLVVHLVDPAGLGFGDVKCAAAAGALTGAVVPTLGPLVGVIAVLLAVIALRLRRHDGSLALGPAIVLGASAGLLLAALVAPVADPAPPSGASHVIRETT